MSADLHATIAPDAPPAALVSTQRVTMRRVIRSEWIKLRSARSSVGTLGFTAAAVVAIGVLISMLGNGEAMGANGSVVYDPAGNSLFGVMVAQLVLGVFGALVMTAEYSCGSISATLTAVPKRLPVLWSKVAVVAVTTFALMVVSLSVAFFAGQALYGGHGPAASLADPGVLRALLAGAMFPTAIAVMGVAFGALMRHSASAIGILFAMLFVVPVLVESLGGVWSDLTSYLPGEAGQAMITLVPNPDQLSPLAGLITLVGWLGVLLTGAAIALRRRDA